MSDDSKKCKCDRLLEEGETECAACREKAETWIKQIISATALSLGLLAPVIVKVLTATLTSSTPKK